MANPSPCPLVVSRCQQELRIQHRLEWVIEYPVNLREGRREVWIECEEGLDSVPEFAYKGTSRTRDEEWRSGNQRGSKRDKSH